ncbi:hypothetical protein [Natrarchaeobius chitinivorans]|uniref:Uncharacterized protein n=1 Tax=Natrarchaeobius chitinivorans TaxID=1679083 RepID=A0A3N6M4I4_NATCH|nr:hypothetical protein [Natrarchaeobius chitinivorans]RQG90880.1 hypothetical protein EA473_20005 [Natrarchaeobius chitinivorans]
MSENQKPFASAGAGITLGLALAAVIVSVVVQPEAIPLSEKFQYVFAALFLGMSIGHYLGEALIDGGEDKKYALVGLFSTLGVLFVVFLVLGRGLTPFAAGIGGTLGFFALCLILSHHSGLIADSERLDVLVGEFAGKISPSGLAFIIVAFVADMAFSQEVAEAMAEVAIYAVAILLAFYILKFREPILAEIKPLLEELKGSDTSKRSR